MIESFLGCQVQSHIEIYPDNQNSKSEHKTFKRDALKTYL